MKIFEVTGFNDAETGMSDYDDILRDPEYFARAKRKKAGVVMMSPKEYVRKAYKGFKKMNPGLTMRQLIDSRDIKIIDQYAQEMRNGAKFPTLSFTYATGFGQEGLHRALAAYKADIKEVPVMIVSTTRQKDRGKLKPTY